MTAALDDPWLTVAEIADVLRVHKATVYRAADGDFLRHLRVGRQIRVRQSWFDEWVNAGAPTHEAQQ